MLQQKRQLAAIMFTDIVGYTALMGSDEQHAFSLLNKNRQLQKPVIEAYNGHWIKEAGDGTMSSFNTVSDAVRAAVKIQEACHAANEFQLRIGIHQGEVVFEEGDVFGDAVNIAARIQAAAGPGSIFISESVNHNILNKKEIITQFVKEEALKNLSQPVRMYQVMFAGSKNIEPEKPVAKVADIEYSIAVLPFVNMSDDREQEFFSDGISEEIINMLAQVSELKVIGRTSSFAFKGKNLDLKIIGEQLKVKHLLEGSVRKSGNKLRVTAQLINVADGFHLYSEKFDRELDDIFTIQDEISEAILNKIKIKLLPDTRAEVFKRDTTSIEAYQYYLKGMYHYNRYDWGYSITAFQSAIKVDPDYAIAYAQMAICFYDLAFFEVDAENNIKHAVYALEKARALDSQSAEFHYALGRMQMWYYWDFEAGRKELEEAVRINPNSAEGHQQLGVLYMFLRNYEKGDTHLSKAAELDPFSIVGLFYIAAAYWRVGAVEKVAEYANRMVALEDNFSYGHIMVGAVHSHNGNIEQHLKEFERAVQLEGNIFNYSYLAGGYVLAGYHEKAREILQIMDKLSGNRSTGNACYGYVFSYLDEYDEAFKYFNLAADRREGHLLNLGSWIDLNYFPDIKNDPRLAALLDRTGLPR